MGRRMLGILTIVLMAASVVTAGSWFEDWESYGHVTLPGAPWNNSGNAYVYDGEGVGGSKAAYLNTAYCSLNRDLPDPVAEGFLELDVDIQGSSPSAQLATLRNTWTGAYDNMLMLGVDSSQAGYYVYLNSEGAGWVSTGVQYNTTPGQFDHIRLEWHNDGTQDIIINGSPAVSGNLTRYPTGNGGSLGPVGNYQMWRAGGLPIIDNIGYNVPEPEKAKKCCVHGWFK